MAGNTKRFGVLTADGGYPASAALDGTETTSWVQGGVTVTGTLQDIADLGGGGVTDGDKGDITVSSSGTVWTVDSDAISNAKLANVATATIKGRSTSGTGDPEDLTASQVRALLGSQSIIVACSDETTALTTGTAKVTFRMPYAFTLTAVRASVTTAPTGSVLTVDINEGGTTILSTKLTIDATEKTSTTAATPPVISDTSLADDAEITIDIDTIGSTIAGAGLKVALIGYAT